MSSPDLSQNSDHIGISFSKEKRTLRLISLTDIIKKEMEASNELNIVESFESLTMKKDLLRDAIKELTESYLNERRFSETFIKRQDIQQYLQHWNSLDTLKDNTENAVDKKHSDSSESIETVDNVCQEMVIEVNKVNDENRKKYSNIDKRLNIVEHKINRIYKLLTFAKKSKSKKPKMKQEITVQSFPKENQDLNESVDLKHIVYDDMYYEYRENIMNSEYYPKSDDTLKLNRKPTETQFHPPPNIGDMFRISSQRQLNRPVFIKAVLRKDCKKNQFKS